MTGSLAGAAVQALIDEAALAPKPGLVDPESRGAHRDLDHERMTLSARALHATFAAVERSARGAEPSLALREEIGALGRRGERAMLQATGGSNAHRGAIWSLGLLVAASSSIGAPAASARDVAVRAAELAAFDDRFARGGVSHGALASMRYGAGGARAEARRGFPHVTAIALPALRRARRNGASETGARLDALLHLIAVLEDTCVLHRGGRGALACARRGAERVLRMDASSPAGMRALRALDREFIERRISPGGSADLLAAALFLDRAAPATA